METITSSRIKNMSPQLLVADIENSIEFYTKKLDFTVDFRFKEFYAGVSKDGYSIHLKVGKPSAEERKNKRNNQDLDIVFSVEGLADLYEDCVNKNVEIIQALRDRPYGKEFYIGDPDGNIICFLEGG
jgi:predicted enzyme related to lactoylglutathione lyase